MQDSLSLAALLSFILPEVQVGGNEDHWLGLRQLIAVTSADVARLEATNNGTLRNMEQRSNCMTMATLMWNPIASIATNNCFIVRIASHCINNPIAVQQPFVVQAVQGYQQ